ncbi:uncharacterized protein DUF4296 [Aquimarina sp. MAR_2010_214]|uniref:DUF4296 domain-containing protein n=1 Tax=Aquimarina sp. MAR_2010_214 TaxID=1250026 RepID=UPI000C6FCC7B|nr:DUF4296 domain-containing protein [Aquimarina sp. MAR_2010_214]PKV48360.1 uncharacterized protein DUF4296 [Aquimarina sp. MAR_2010_214]
MIRNVIYFAVFLSFISCQSVNKPSKPETFIEEDRMVEILTDIAFVKAAKSSNRKTFEEKSINPEAFILKKHGIDSIVFTENNIWYSDQIEKYKGIITRVKANLDKEATKYEKLKKEEDSIKKIKDSIARHKDTLKIEEELDVKERAIDKGINALSKKQ